MSQGDHHEVDLPMLEAAYGRIGRNWQRRSADFAAMKNHINNIKQLGESMGGLDFNQLRQLRDDADARYQQAKEERVAARQRLNGASHLDGMIKTIEENNPTLFADLDQLCGKAHPSTEADVPLKEQSLP